MARSYLERGALAGLAGGLGYGLFLATVGSAFGAGLEAVESGHDHAGAGVSEATTAAVSVGSGVLWGLLLGIVVFGVAYYFLEPALPGSGVTKRLGFAGGGFLVVSGAPWLVLPPQAPGVEQALPTETRMAWYGGLMALGAVVVVLAGLAHRETADRHLTVRTLATVAPLALLSVPVLLAPANPTHGHVPPALATAYRFTVVFGQVGLWATVAGVHAWLDEPELLTAERTYPSAAD